MKYQEKVIRSTFVGRPNRFVSIVRLPSGEEVKAHMPNPGRMWELLFEGVTIFIMGHGNAQKGDYKTAYRVVGIERDGVPILLDTHYTNDMAAHLINNRLVPGWEEYHVKQREVTVGNSRFDLLLEKENGEQRMVEVKSCTLFGKKGAMFPDAITERGRRHMEELAEMSKEGIPTGLLWMVHWGRAEWFMPDYHTDLAFSQTFLKVYAHLDWKALALEWTEDFTKPIVKGLCKFSPKVLEKEAKDRGAFALIFEMEKSKDIDCGELGKVFFEKGFYIYISSEGENLTKRLSRHQRKRKTIQWPVDALRNESTWITAVPIRSGEEIVESFAKEVKTIVKGEIKDFIKEGRKQPSPLYHMDVNPIHEKEFMDIVEEFRMNRLDNVILKSSI